MLLYGRSSCIVLRFLQDLIYTNVADVLISVNPYKSIPLLYEMPLQQKQGHAEDDFEDSDGEREVVVCDIAHIGQNKLLNICRLKKYMQNVEERLIKADRSYETLLFIHTT